MIYCQWLVWRLKWQQVMIHDTLLMHSFHDVLPREILEKYTEGDFNAKHLMTDPVTKSGLFFYLTCLIPQKVLSHLSGYHLQRIQNEI
jgi:hypothetical protein